MDAKDVRKIVGEECKALGWDVRSVAFRSCNATMVHPETGAIVSAQWSSMSDAETVGSMVRLAINIDGAAAIKGAQQKDSGDERNSTVQ